MRQNLPLVQLQDLVNMPGDQHVSAYALAEPVLVKLPPLATGQHMLAEIDVPAGPGGTHWSVDHYTSIGPVMIEFHDVLVHGAAGIVCAGGQLVENTLHQAHQALEGWSPLQDRRATLDLADDIIHLPGRHLSLPQFRTQFVADNLAIQAARQAADKAHLVNPGSLAPAGAEFNHGFGVRRLLRRHRHP